MNIIDMFINALLLSYQKMRRVVFEKSGFTQSGQ